MWDREKKRRNRETVGIEITCCFNPTGIENTEKQKGMTFDYTTVKKNGKFPRGVTSYLFSYKFDHINAILFKNIYLYMNKEFYRRKSQRN